MTNRQGQRLGNYRLIRLLGQGGFAEVYLGEHVFLGTQAAIKVLLVRLADEEMEGFLKEARTIAGLTHPNILRVLEFGVEENVPFLVLEFAPNGTLRKRHPKGSILPLTVIVPYVSQIASALQYIHNRKLIHRDIKPENLLLGTNFEVLLSDFGTAMVFQTLHTQGTLEMAGTVSYMAPEQIRGKPRPASDQYGLGVVVYEWLCGVPPFQGSFTEMYSQHMLAIPPSLRGRNPTISPEVEQVVLTTLSKEPEQRFASVSAFANALEQASKPVQRDYSSTSTVVSQPSSRSSNIVSSEEEGLPTLNASVSELMSRPASTTPHYSTQEHTAVPGSEPVAPQPVITPEPVLPPPKDKPSRGISRRAVVVGLLGLVSVAVAGGAAWLIVSKQNPFAFGSGAIPTPTPTPIPGTTYITYRGHIGPVYAIAWAPKGLHIASGGADKTVQVWDANTGKRLVTYTGHIGSVLSVTWSLDNTRIASGSADNTVQVWNAATAGKSFSNTYSDWVNAVTWSPGGNRIASGGRDKMVHVWDAFTGAPVLTYNLHSNAIYAVKWSPDGQHIASSSEEQVRIWNPTPPAPKTLNTYAGNMSSVKAVSWSPDGMRIASGGGDPTQPRGGDTTVQIWQAI